MSQPGCPKPFCSSGEWCAEYRRCLFNGEPFACAGGCELTYPHYHTVTPAPAGNIVDVTVYISEDPNAEVRDPDTGDVIFRATKTKLRVIALSSDPRPLGSAREATEGNPVEDEPRSGVRHGRDSQGGER